MSKNQAITIPRNVTAADVDEKLCKLATGGFVIPENTTNEEIDKVFGVGSAMGNMVKFHLGRFPVLTRWGDASIPYRLVSMSNARMHWAKRSKLVKEQRGLGATLVLKALGGTPLIRKIVKSGETIVVRFTRVGGRRLDDDNNVSSFKAFRDSAAKLFGIDDGDARWRWEYAQEKGAYAVRVEVWTEKGAE